MSTKWLWLSLLVAVLVAALALARWGRNRPEGCG
jgi:hypothetical protein